MKLKTILWAVGATFGFCSASEANITSAVWNTSDPSALACYAYPFNGTILGVDATQMGSVAAIAGTIQTDTIGDPTLTLASSVNNDTGMAWNRYEVNVTMHVPFTFVNLPPTVSNPPNNDWFVAGDVQPVTTASRRR